MSSSVAFREQDGRSVPRRMSLGGTDLLRGSGPLILVWLLHTVTVWLLAWYAAVVLESRLIPAREPTPIGTLAAWDGTHYGAITREGYSTAPGDVPRFAFFPLFPALARAVGGVTHAPLAGLVLNQLLLLGSVLLLRQWREPESGHGLRAEPGFWLVVAPLAFFYSAFYAESLFLFLTLLALTLQRRGRRLAAAGALLLGGLTRPTAILLPLLFVPALLDRTRRREALVLAAAPLAGMAAYLLYVGVELGSFTGYQRIQAEFWGHRWTVPFHATLAELRHALARLAAAELPQGHQLLRLLVPVGFVALLAIMWRRVEPGFRCYLIGGLLFVHSQLPSLSSARYDLALFPIFIILARTPLARSRAGLLLAMVLLGFQMVFLLDFLIWEWAA